MKNAAFLVVLIALAFALSASAQQNPGIAAVDAASNRIGFGPPRRIVRPPTPTGDVSDPAPVIIQTYPAQQGGGITATAVVADHLNTGDRIDVEMRSATGGTLLRSIPMGSSQYGGTGFILAGPYVGIPQSLPADTVITATVARYSNEARFVGVSLPIANTLPVFGIVQSPDGTVLTLPGRFALGVETNVFWGFGDIPTEAFTVFADHVTIDLGKGMAYKWTPGTYTVTIRQGEQCGSATISLRLYF